MSWYDSDVQAMVDSIIGHIVGFGFGAVLLALILIGSSL